MKDVFVEAILLKAFFKPRHIVMIIGLCVGAAVFGVAQSAHAGSASAILDKTQGSVHDQFVVTLTITGKLKSNVEPPAIDGCGENCEVAQAGVSHNMQWVNGEFSSEDQYTFVIQPQKAGNFAVTSWKLKVDGEEITTLPLKFSVTGQQSQKNQQDQPGQQAPAPGSSGLQAPAPGSSGDEIYIERENPARDPYVGEAFVSTIRVFHKIKITAAAPKRESAPEFRMLAVPGEKTYQRVINNVRYQVIEFKEALIPLRAGTHTLPAYKLQARVMRALQKMPGGSVFDFFSNQFFGGPGGMGGLSGMFGREENVDVRGKPTPVTVRELPAAGRPAGFAGLVGQFSLQAETLVREVAPGDSITVVAKVDGLGALDTLDQVANSLKDTGKVYPDKPLLKEEFVAGADGATILRSRKEFKMAVVPVVNSGRVDLGKVSIAYFDTGKNSYEVLVADFGGVDIKGGAALPGISGVANQADSGVSAPKKIIAGDESRRLPAGIITLLLAIAGAGVATMLWRRRQPGVNEFPEAELDVTLPLPHESNLDAKSPTQFWDDARRQATAGMIPEALASVEHGLREIISLRAGRNVAAMTPREIRALEIISLEGCAALAYLDQIEEVIFSERVIGKDEVLQFIERANDLPRQSEV